MSKKKRFIAFLTATILILSSVFFFAFAETEVDSVADLTDYDAATEYVDNYADNLSEDENFDENEYIDYEIAKSQAPTNSAQSDQVSMVMKLFNGKMMG